MSFKLFLCTQSQAAKQDRTKDSASDDRPSTQPYSDCDDSDVEILTEESDNSFSNSKPCSLAFSLHSPNPSSQTDGSKPRTVQSKLFSHLSTSQGDGVQSPSNRGKCIAKENVQVKPAQDSTPESSQNSFRKVASPLLLSQDGNAKSSPSHSSSLKVSSPRQPSGSKSQQGLAVAGGSSSPSGSPLVEKGENENRISWSYTFFYDKVPHFMKTFSIDPLQLFLFLLLFLFC